jgi:hypothetical protein
MKTSLKSLLIILLILASSNLNAQTRFGIKGGVNLAKMSLKSSGLSFDPKSVIGFHAGLISEISISDNLKVQPGVLFSTKGSKYEISFLEETFETTISPGVVEVPINLLYYFGSGSTRFSIFGGPYVAYGFMGKTEIEGTSEDIKFGTTDEDDMNPLDYGVNIGAGVNLGSFLISAQYGIGLANLAPDTSGDVEMKNTVIGISVGFLFGGK